MTVYTELNKARDDALNTAGEAGVSEGSSEPKRQRKKVHTKVPATEFKPELRFQVMREGKLQMETFPLHEVCKRDRDAKSLVKKLLAENWNARTISHKTSHGHSYAVYAKPK